MFYGACMCGYVYVCVCVCVFVCVCMCVYVWSNDDERAPSRSYRVIGVIKIISVIVFIIRIMG